MNTHDDIPLKYVLGILPTPGTQCDHPLSQTRHGYSAGLCVPYQAIGCKHVFSKWISYLPQTFLSLGCCAEKHPDLQSRSEGQPGSAH